MKKRCVIIAALTTVMLLAGAMAGLAQEAGSAPASWTVMIYMCGSDLESEGGMATVNLEEISRSSPFPDVAPAKVPLESAINILIETGGCMQWRTERKLGFSIASDRLQRYRYQPEREQPFVLEEEEPLGRMSDPATLSAFIRWGVQTCPAERYALVLWGHGGGSHTGLLPDECYDGQYMNLAQLDEALTDGGVHFDTLLMDACMMANLETALAVQPHTDWFVASEEIAAGSGSAYDVWLNELYACPESDGYRLGRNICDSVQKKYADLGDEQAKSILTFSLIDTSKLDAVSARFDQLWQWIGELYEREPEWFGFLCAVLGRSERYGTTADHMMDIGSMLTQPYSAGLIDGDMRSGISQALIEAVPYMVKGSGRSESHGLSFCFGTDMSAEELDVYAANCQSAAYLALLDAVNADWQAPEWVYGQTRRLTGMEDMESYEVDATIDRNGVGGMPELIIKNPLRTIANCNYVLYRKGRDGQELYKLGQRVCEISRSDEREMAFSMIPATTWPSIGGEICDLELVNRTNTCCLYNIPMMVVDTRYDLRVALVFDEGQMRFRRDWYLGNPELSDVRLDAGDENGDYEVYGFWKGYEDNSLNASRNTTSPALLEGQEYHLLYPIRLAGGNQPTYYHLGALREMPRVIELEEAPLPEGEYAASFLIKDILGRNIETELIDLYWNGQTWCKAD